MRISNMKIYGATEECWLHFDIVLGLTSELLPVVSNHDAKISANSTLKTLGKTPSLYNRKKEVVGLKLWTDKISTSTDIEKWSKNSDYGICIQTRRIRAIDVDVSDPTLAKKIKYYISKTLGFELPCRRRTNSSKFLLIFEMLGDYTKQIIKLDNDIIEFLANGQQFIAVGTHPSGEPYFWEKGLPTNIPTLTHDQFTQLWQAISKKFNGEIINSRKHKARDLSVSNHLATDDIANFLDENWQVFSVGKAGERYIECPFSSDHTSESNETATAYFPSNTRGFEQGHFRCLHAHCENKDDGEFLNAMGYRSKDFDVIQPFDNEKLLPVFKRDNKGKIEATINNVYLAVQRSDICGINVRFDKFKDEIMYSSWKSDQWLAFNDADYSRLRIGLEKGGFKPIGREMIRDVVVLVADENPFDSATEWISRLEWDGIPRIENFLSEYFNADHSGYVKAVSLYLWTALAGRVLKPGIKADMVPILVGEQGCGKSTGVAALSPSLDYFCEISFTEKDEDLARKMRGRLVAEIGELRGLHTKELETIKAFITRTHENWIPKYREFATKFPRRLVFVGTTNQDEFLADDTGNRRFLPVKVNDVNVSGIKENIDLLWAEAKQLFLKTGIQYQVAEKLSVVEHEKYMIKDAWEDAVNRWLNEPDMLTNEKPIDKPYLKNSDVLKEALKMEPKNIKKSDEMRMSKTLKVLGYERKLIRDGSRVLKAFIKKTET